MMAAPDGWLTDFEKIAIRDEVRPLIPKQNAMRVLGRREVPFRREAVRRESTKV